jgi:hypothetical protein
MSDSYAARTHGTNGSGGASNDLFFMMLLDLMLSVDPEALANDPAFIEFAKAAGWQPGQPIPQTLAAEFLADRLARKVADGAQPQDAAQALKAELGARSP